MGVLELLGILQRREVLLLPVEIVLVHLFFELDVFLVDSVDLLSQVLVLSLESLDEFVLVFNLLNLFVVHVGLNFDLVSQRNELLSFQHNLHVVALVSFAGRLAFLGLERSVVDLN